MQLYSNIHQQFSHNAAIPSLTTLSSCTHLVPKLPKCPSTFSQKKLANHRLFMSSLSVWLGKASPLSLSLSRPFCAHKHHTHQSQLNNFDLSFSFSFPLSAFCFCSIDPWLLTVSSTTVLQRESTPYYNLYIYSFHHFHTAFCFNLAKEKALEKTTPLKLPTLAT